MKNSCFNMGKISIDNFLNLFKAFIALILLKSNKSIDIYRTFLLEVVTDRDRIGK